MEGSFFKDIEKLKADLWAAVDNLRANSKLTSRDYFMPVLGIIFLRHAANRYDAATRQIEQDKAASEMPKRAVIDQDYVRRRALPLPEEARYDWIMTQATSGKATLPKLFNNSMKAIKQRFEPLKNLLPKEYGIFEGQGMPKHKQMSKHRFWTDGTNRFLSHHLLKWIQIVLRDVFTNMCGNKVKRAIFRQMETRSE
jgi:hypothetical protein